MKEKILLIALLFMVNISFAQIVDGGVTKMADKNFRLRNPPQPDSLAPLIVINNKQFKGTAILDLVHPDQITDVRVLQDSEGKGAYGELAKFGVLEIEVKKPQQWITLKRLFRKFNISKKDWGLDVMVNERKMLNKEQFIVGKGWVKNIRIGEKLNSLNEKIRYISLNN